VYQDVFTPLSESDRLSCNWTTRVGHPIYYSSAMPRVTSERLAVGLLFVVIAALACFAPAQNDTWMLMRDGQDVWRMHHVPLVDGYSFTAAGQFWPNHEWLTGLAFYGAHFAGGMPLLTALCAAVIVGAWALSWRLTAGPFELRFLVFAASLITVVISWADRPQVFTMAAFMLTVNLLTRNRLIWLPAVFVVWANMHGAVVLGLVAVAGALLARTIADRRLSKGLVLVLVACLGATFISPLGARLWTFIPESMTRSRANQLIEWLPPDFSAVFWPFWGIAAALPIAMILGWRCVNQRTLTLALIAFAVLPLAVTSRRNASVFLLVGVPALTALVGGRSRSASAQSLAQEHPTVNGVFLAAAAVGASVVVALGWAAPAPSLDWQPLPSAAIKSIAACGGPMYNHYGDGGALIWFVPQQKVFIDSRQDPYPLNLLVADHQLELDGKYDEIFGRYGIRCAVVPPNSPTARSLRATQAWTERYSDGRWTVFAKHP
jgi:hypothetical protein